MGKYKVLVLGIQGNGKKVYKAGDIVDDKNFPEGNAKELLKKGFLGPVAKTKAEKAAIKKAEKDVAEKSAAVDQAKEAVQDAEVKQTEAEKAISEAAEDISAEDKKVLDDAVEDAEELVAEAYQILADAEGELDVAIETLAKL